MTGVEIDIIKRVELVTLKIFCGISHTQNLLWNWPQLGMELVTHEL